MLVYEHKTNGRKLVPNGRKLVPNGLSVLDEYEIVMILSASKHPS